MKFILIFIVACSLFHCFVVRAEDVAELRKKGILALKQSETDPHAIITAARNFAKAADLYAAAGNDEMTIEMNTYLYWCKRKMTLSDIQEFTSGGEGIGAEKLHGVESVAPKPDDAPKWFARAETFAKENPNEHFLIAVRFFEVASRFLGAKESKAAEERSAKEFAAAKAALPNTGQTAHAGAGKTINLLPLIDPAPDAIAGKWALNGAALAGEKADFARIEIPYHPPDEYDFKVVFMRQTGNGSVVQIAQKSAFTFAWIMDGWENSVSGIDSIGGKGGDKNSTTIKGPLITNGTWHTSIVQVRYGGVMVLFDGKQVVKYVSNDEKMDISPKWKLHDVFALGLGHADNTVQFSAIEVIEITGVGRIMR